MKALGIIPARFGSTRLEGKPLVDIRGKSMIERVYERASQAFSCVVATDDQRIFDEVKRFGGEVVMTSTEHTTGTNRCLEALSIYSAEKGENFDVVVNVQGDEPLVHPSQLTDVLKCFETPGTELATLVIPVQKIEDLFNESECFVTLDDHMNALYFSRAVIPAVRGVHKTKWLEHHTYYKHLGLYAYTPAALKAFAEMPVSSLEKAESLEQNRWLQSGRKMQVALTEFDSIPVDTLDDLQRVRDIFREQEAG